jgi:hypothetical protein
MAVLPNWNLTSIRKHRKDSPDDELFKVINIDGVWRMSSVVRVMHTHLVTFEHVFPENHLTKQPNTGRERRCTYAQRSRTKGRRGSGFRKAACGGGS